MVWYKEIWLRYLCLQTHFVGNQWTAASVFVNSPHGRGKTCTGALYNTLAHVDNTTDLIYAWDRRLGKQSERISILIQTLHLCEFVLSCIYLNRDLMARLVDRLSRTSTSTEATCLN
jgi:hypothetical protein